jgi:nucleoside-diphosphate-sugar epimerase
MTNYLVTGGAGFIGSHLVRQLVWSGHRVRVFDNYSTGKIENLHDVSRDIEMVEGDLRDNEAVLRAVEGIEVIFHVGAIPSVPKSIRDPGTSDRVNTGGTLNVLHAAVTSGVRRVIYSASSSVYGNANTVPKTEAMLADPMSPYAISKYSGELYCRVFHQIYGLETVSLRYFNVFGPRQDPDSEYAAVIPKFIRTISLRNQPVIFGDGTQSRDFTYIDNVIRANVLAAHAPRLQGESVNIGCGERITLNHLVELINDVLKTEVSPIYAVPRQGDVMHSLAAIQAAQALLGYVPCVSLREGLERTIRWFQEEG